MAVETFTKTGTKSTTAAKLSSKVFGLKVESHDLVNQAYNTYLANGRIATATTKKRGEVRGGGRKPWKQKGTGRARAGSIRSPIWRGGGITFGPSGEENYSKALSKKSKLAALRQSLSLANTANKIAVIDSIDADGKTATVAKLLAKVGANRRTLLVDEQPSPELRRSVSNLKDTQVIAADYVNVYAIVNADRILFTKKALTALEAKLGGSK